MTFLLSDEQNGVLARGSDRRVSWRPVVLPERGPVPEWALDLNVDFAEGYGNEPRYKIKATGDLRSWPEKRFTKAGPRFMAEHPDGRAEIYYHAGALRTDTLRRFRTLDGQLHAYRPYKPERVTERDDRGQMIASYHPFEDGEWVEVERLCTPQQDGFAGAHIDITLDDGSEITLRGPWHGASPPEFLDLAYIDWSDRAYWRRGVGPGRNWAAAVGGRGGLYLSHATFISLFARFVPHLDLLVIEEGGRARLQAAKPEWNGRPKAVVQQEQRQRTKQEVLAELRAAGEAGVLPGPGAPLWAYMELAREGLATSTGRWDAATYRAVVEAAA